MEAPAAAPAPTRPELPPAALARIEQRLQAAEEERARLTARVDLLERQVGPITGSTGGSAGGFAAASAPPLAPPALTAAPEEPAESAQFGIDLGAEPSLQGLRTRWATLRAAHRAELEGLTPRVGVRERDNGAAELRLLAGPFRNLFEAARTCVVLSGRNAGCFATGYEGQRLSSR